MGTSIRKIEALQAMVKLKNGRRDSGVTTTERDKAARVLDDLQLSREGNLAVPERDTTTDQWSAQGTLILTRNGSQQYLRQSSLSYLLSHVEEGKTFNLRTVGVNLSFGSGDFYVVLRWLKNIGAVLKVAGGYMISSIEDVKARWNNIVTKQMVL